MHRSTGDYAYVSPKPDLRPLANETTDGATVSANNEKEDATPMLAEVDDTVNERYVLAIMAEVSIYLSTDMTCKAELPSIIVLCACGQTAERQERGTYLTGQCRAREHYLVRLSCFISALSFALRGLRKRGHMSR